MLLDTLKVGLSRLPTNPAVDPTPSYQGYKIVWLPSIRDPGQDDFAVAFPGLTFFTLLRHWWFKAPDVVHLYGPDPSGLEASRHQGRHLRSR